MDTDLRQQPVANECADNTYYEIADESECGSPYDLSGQPAGTRPTNNMTSAEEGQAFGWCRFAIRLGAWQECQLPNAGITDAGPR